MRNIFLDRFEYGIRHAIHDIEQNMQTNTSVVYHKYNIVSQIQFYITKNDYWKSTCGRGSNVIYLERAIVRKIAVFGARRSTCVNSIYRIEI